MNRLLIFFIIPFFVFSQTEQTDPGKKIFKPIFDIGIGLPWVINTQAGIQYNNHKVTLLAKSFFVYTKSGGAYNYSLSQKVDIGFSFGIIHPSSFLNSENSEQDVQT